MDHAAYFLAGSILYMLSAIVIVLGILAINNLFHRFWKPFTVWMTEDAPIDHKSKNQEPSFKSKI